MLVRFIKNWTLPLAMLAGTLGYFFFADIPFVAPAKHYVNVLVAFLTPLLIFSQLLLTFCKVEAVSYTHLISCTCSSSILKMAP